MPQIRKYEVDAIVDGICTQILVSRIRSEELAHFNLNVIKNEAFKATIPYSYNNIKSDELKIETDLSSYSTAREEVFNRLTIALLPSDSMDNIQAIMSTIVDEFLNV